MAGKRCQSCLPDLPSFPGFKRTKVNFAQIVKRKLYLIRLLDGGIDYRGISSFGGLFNVIHPCLLRMPKIPFKSKLGSNRVHIFFTANLYQKPRHNQHQLILVSTKCFSGRTRIGNVSFYLYYYVELFFDKKGISDSETLRVFVYTAPF